MHEPKNVHLLNFLGNVDYNGILTQQLWIHYIYIVVFLLMSCAICVISILLTHIMS